MIILFSIILLIAMMCILTHATIKKNKRTIIFESIFPATTIIAFDIHGVLFEPDFAKIKQLLKSNKSAFRVLLYLFWPPFIADLVKLILRKTVPEEFIKQLCARYKGIAPYKKLAFELANAQKPINSMHEIVFELKKLGYELHIFSNIGSEIFNELAKQHAELFSQFSKIYVPHMANSFIGKPRQKAFQDYLNRCNQDNKQIVFIDNRRRNVKAAHERGIQGLHCKSPAQIHKTLQELHIIPQTIANIG